MTARREFEGHTPLPWRVEQDTTLIWGACTDDPSTYGMGRPIIEARRGSFTPEGEANVALIVAAVNERPTLLAERDALRAQVAELAGAHEAALQDANRLALAVSGLLEFSQRIEVCSLDGGPEAVRKARAALAKVAR